MSQTIGWITHNSVKKHLSCSKHRSKDILSKYLRIWQAIVLEIGKDVEHLVLFCNTGLRLFRFLNLLKHFLIECFSPNSITSQYSLIQITSKYIGSKVATS